MIVPQEFERLLIILFTRALLEEMVTKVLLLSQKRNNSVTVSKITYTKDYSLFTKAHIVMPPSVAILHESQLRDARGVRVLSAATWCPLQPVFLLVVAPLPLGVSQTARTNEECFLELCHWDGSWSGSNARTSGPSAASPFPPPICSWQACYSQAGAATRKHFVEQSRKKGGVTNPNFAFLRGAWGGQVVPLSCWRRRRALAERSKVMQSKSQTSVSACSFSAVLAYCLFVLKEQACLTTPSGESCNGIARRLEVACMASSHLEL